MTIDKNSGLAIVCDGGIGAVTLAANDLARDFWRVLGAKVPVLPCADGFAVRVGTADASLWDVTDTRAESFTVEVSGKGVLITGGGPLGTIYGIYAFSERFLGVQPTYLFDDLEVARKERVDLAPCRTEETPEKGGFRGVFINDEDLLTGWRPTGARREIGDYKWYRTVVDPQIIDRVCETVLRLRLNLIIPGSFINILNASEKALVDTAARRGLYVSQHHAEPCGVSHFTFDAYCRKHGINAPMSFVSAKETLEAVWRTYIRAWAAYPRVVWQLGLRGRADRPVWWDDKHTPDGDAAHGALISEAYALQKRLIDEETHGSARFFTTTLWMEGAALYEKGVLTFPKGTTVILSDIGVNQMFANDFDTVRVESSYGYGIYYHVAYYGHGPHLAPMTGLDKLAYNLCRAHRKGFDDYTILNVSNVREFTYEIRAYADCLWSPDAFSPSACALAYARAVLPDDPETLAGLIDGYYHAFAVLDNRFLRVNYADLFHYNYEERVPGVDNLVLKDGLVLILGRYCLNNAFLGKADAAMAEELDAAYTAVTDAAARLRAVRDGFAAFAETAGERAGRHITVKWRLAADTVLALYGWYRGVYGAYRAFADGEKRIAADRLANAAAILRDYLQTRKIAEYGEFAHWYDGDEKFDVPGALTETENAGKRMETEEHKED